MVWTHRTASVFAIINFKREREGAGLSKVLRVHSLIFRSGVQVIWVVRWLICNQREDNISCCVILISYRDPPRPGSCSQALVTTTCSPGGSRRPSCWLHRAFLCLDRLCPGPKRQKLLRTSAGSNPCRASKQISPKDLGGRCVLRLVGNCVG